MNNRLEPAPADFLDRLVGKARGEDGGLQPRLPSRFEPTRHVRMDMAVEAEWSGSVDERAGDTRQTARDAPAQPRAPVAQARADAPATAPTRPLGEPASSAETPAETAPTTPALVPFVVARPPRAFEPLDAADDGDALAPTPPRLRVSRAPLVAVLGDPVPTRDRAPDVANEAPSTPAAAPAVSAAESPRRAIVDGRVDPTRPPGRVPTKAGALVPSLDPALRGVVVEARTPPRRSLSEPLRVERSAGDEAPVVNVTIGRVEVRAVQAPAPQPPRRPRGPQPMSLAEYLERRASGR